MSVVRYERPTEALVEHIAANMREADVKEVWASGDHTPLSALQFSIDESEYSTVAIIDDIPVAVFGLAVSGILTTYGVPWMLGTDDVVLKRRAFLPNSKRVIEQMLAIAPYLYNYAHADNKVSIRWLKWLGFKFDDAAPYGPHGEPFRRFSMEMNRNV